MKIDRDWETFFRGKKITLMGLGLLGRGVNIAKFLVCQGAELLITDLKSKETLAPSLEELKEYQDKITYVLGQHRMQDFEGRDLVIKTAGVPLDSPFIEHAHKSNVPAEMDASLFARLAPTGVIIIGITGTRGKSTTTQMIYSILEQAGRRVFLGGNVRGLATLPLLEKVKSGDYIVLELDSWQLQGFGEAKISPHVAVFTNFLDDHMNYYKGNRNLYFADKANIFLYQKEGDLLVAGDAVAKTISDIYSNVLKGKLISRGAEDLPPDIKLIVEGEHNRANAALASEASKFLGIKDQVIKKALEAFPAVEGRLQYLGSKNDIKVYNDNNATTPEATVVGLTALDKEQRRKIVLIMGGADKGLDTTKLVRAIGEHCRAVILISGTGTEKIKPQILSLGNIAVDEEERLEAIVGKATRLAEKGDVILFSPAFASFSKYFENEYERNDQFVAEIRKWLDQKVTGQ